jgi:hypothetical protein
MLAHAFLLARKRQGTVLSFFDANRKPGGKAKDPKGG